ncbi:PH domain-containing protein [Candidatus Dojkabacteria bacterium]|nr:PH domain-containing protein [Candidatus Dojkabacteria bacterium]
MALNTRQPQTNKPSKVRSYLAKIADARNAGPLAQFLAFPDQVSFVGQESSEKIVLFMRQHYAVLIPDLLRVLLLFILPFVLVPVVIASGLNIDISYIPFLVGLAIFWSMMIVTFSVTSFFRWFYSINIVTNERIIDIDFRGIVNHRVAEAQLERVEDVSHSPIGVWATLFDFGTVFIQTAGEQREFQFENVPRPRDVQDTILDLLEEKQRNG